MSEIKELCQQQHMILQEIMKMLKEWKQAMDTITEEADKELEVTMLEYSRNQHKLLKKLK